MEREYNIIEALNMPEGTRFKVIIQNGVEVVNNMVIKKFRNGEPYLSWDKFGSVQQVTKSLVNAKYIIARKEYNFFEAMKMIDQGKKMTNKKIPNGSYYKKNKDNKLMCVYNKYNEKNPSIGSMEIYSEWYEYI